MGGTAACRYEGQTAARSPGTDEERPNPAAGTEGGSQWSERPPVRVFAAVVGAAFALAGIGSFIPGITWFTNGPNCLHNSSTCSSGWGSWPPCADSVGEPDSDAEFSIVNDADKMLHLGLSTGMTGVGLLGLLTDRRQTTASVASFGAG